MRHLVVDRAHHLLGRDAVGHERGDQRAGAGPDVDVELVDRAVDRQQVERPQRADLVDAAGEPAAAQHQRGSRLPAPLAPGRGVHLDDVAHVGHSLRSARDFRPPEAGCVGSNADGPARRPHHARRRWPCSRVRRRRPGSPRPARPGARDGARGRLLRRLRGRPRTPGGSSTPPRADVARMPASVEKLYTTATAMLRYGADGTSDHLRAVHDAARRDRHDRRQPRAARRRRPDVRHAPRSTALAAQARATPA